MKKIVKKALLVLVLAFSLSALAACSKDEPTPDPTPTATAEPTQETTPEPTATPTPTEEVTPEPTEEPIEDPVDVDGPEEGSEVDSIKEIASDVDQDAINVAVTFLDNLLHSKLNEAVMLVAFEPEKAAEVTGQFGSVSSSLPEEITSMLDMFKVEVTGAKRAASADELAGMSDCFVDISTVSDLHIVTVKLTTENQAIAALLGKSFMNFAVAKYNGEYKVLSYVSGIEETSEPVGGEGGEGEEEGYEVQVIGSDTPEGIIEIFAEANKTLDVDTLLGCIAVNETNMSLFEQAGASSKAAMELMKGLIGENGIDITYSEAEEVTQDDLNGITEVYVSITDVTDIVKFPMTAKVTVMGQEQVTNSYVYVGKYNGQYRIITQETLIG